MCGRLSTESLVVEGMHVGVAYIGDPSDQGVGTVEYCWWRGFVGRRHARLTGRFLAQYWFPQRDAHPTAKHLICREDRIHKMLETDTA